METANESVFAARFEDAAQIRGHQQPTAPNGMTGKEQSCPRLRNQDQAAAAHKAVQDVGLPIPLESFSSVNLQISAPQTP